MEVDVFMLAESVRISAKQDFSITGGGQNAFVFESFPASCPPIPLALEIRFRGFERGQAYELAIDLCEEEGRACGTVLRHRFDVPKDSRHLSRTLSAKLALMLTGMTFRKPGIYELRVHVGSKTVKRFVIYVAGLTDSEVQAVIGGDRALVA